MNANLSILHLVLNASFVVQLVMLLLVAVSVASWAAIFRKLFALKTGQGAQRGLRARVLVRHQPERPVRLGRAERQSCRPDGAHLCQRHARVPETARTPDQDAGTLLDGARRAMRASYQRELDVVESNLSFLASVGSVSPYVGLFGTVWGIMHAFTGLASLQTVTLATVAPGIAEALVATAIGLFAAIPAVVAYNRFAHDIDRVANKLETFIEEFSNILQRNLGASGSATPSGR